MITSPHFAVGKRIEALAAILGLRPQDGQKAARQNLRGEWPIFRNYNVMARASGELFGCHPCTSVDPLESSPIPRLVRLLVTYVLSDGDCGFGVFDGVRGGAS
jgi:hypothetical protein